MNQERSLYVYNSLQIHDSLDGKAKLEMIPAIFAKCSDQCKNVRRSPVKYEGVVNSHTSGQRATLLMLLIEAFELSGYTHIRF